MLTSLSTITCFFAAINPVSARCREFNPQLFQNTSRYTFTTIDRSFRVSEIINCSTVTGQTPPGIFPGFASDRCESNQCVVATEENFKIRLNRTLSVDVSESVADSLFEMVQHYFTIVDDSESGQSNTSDTDFNATKIWPVDQVSACINESEAAWWGFTGIYRCIEGTVSGCDGRDGLADQTLLRACGVATTNPARSAPEADLRLVRGGGYNSTIAPPNATEISNAAMRMGLPFVSGRWTSLLLFTLLMGAGLV